MTLNDEQQENFKNIVRPVIEFLNNNSHPHTKIIITSTSAELYEGILSLETLDYIKD